MMRLMKFVLCIALFLSHTLADNTDGSEEWLNQLSIINRLAEESGIYRDTNSQTGRSTGTIDFDVKMECTPQPKTIHQLRPQDIDVFGAMGDSITAGFGIDSESLADLATEYRGLSWSIGGDQALNTSLTLPNIVRHFNPSVKGYSTGDRIINRDNWFNVAVGGARSRDMPNQARVLIDNMLNDERTNYENDWKVVTIFIGGNDLCALNRSEDASPENFVKFLKEGLDILHAELPRTLVNVVDILEIYLLPQVGHGYGSTAACRATQATFCNYVYTAQNNPEQMEHIKSENKRYQSLTKELIDSGIYDTRDDFTVVLQPFFRDTELPYTEDGEVDSTYFAPDCFHFSSKGHAMAALNLWNNMLEPVGQKTTVWGIRELKCPTEEYPFIGTRLNSEPVTGGSGDTSTIPDTTTMPVDTTTPIAVTTTTTKETPIDCEKIVCTEVVPDWMIAVLCLFAAAFVLQAVVIIVVSKSHSMVKMKSSSSSYNVKL